MAIDEQGWFTWAFRKPGPASKKYVARNRNLGVCWHSAEGGLNSILQTLNNMQRRASWTGTIAKNGVLYQHYVVSDSVWTSGSYQANTRYIAFESEGFAGEPLTKEQGATVKRIIQDCEEAFGWVGKRGETLFEHREMHALHGSPPTACPSDRYDWIWAELEGDLNEAETLALINKRLKELGLDDIDDRLREVSVARERLRHLASDIDAKRVENALKILRDGGMQL